MSAYFRTAKGSHKHLSFECANQRRALESGAPTATDEDLPACEHCCDTAEVAASVAKIEAQAATMCRNSAVRKPRHIESECTDCGKRGKVNRATGTLRAHKAA